MSLTELRQAVLTYQNQRALDDVEEDMNALLADPSKEAAATLRRILDAYDLPPPRDGTGADLI